jgi:hypothetical protein
MLLIRSGLAKAGHIAVAFSQPNQRAALDNEHLGISDGLGRERVPVTAENSDQMLKEYHVSAGLPSVDPNVGPARQALGLPLAAHLFPRESSRHN